jgi:hypothetical protein
MWTENSNHHHHKRDRVYRYYGKHAEEGRVKSNEIPFTIIHNNHLNNYLLPVHFV